MATGGEDWSDETFDFHCNTCWSENRTSKAADYCRACTEFFCEDCLRHHNRMPLLKTHRDKLVGKDDFKDMTKTRAPQTTTVSQSPDDLLFGCHNCSDAGHFRMAVDYCKECKNFLCDSCLRLHNKLSNHSDKLMGTIDFRKMVDARKTLSRSMRTPAPAQPGPSSSDQGHGRVPRPKQQPVQSPSPSTSSGQQQVDAAKLAGGMLVGEVDFTEKVQVHHEKDGRKCKVQGVCCLPDGGWLVADYKNGVVKRLDASHCIIDRCKLPGAMCDLCLINDNNSAAVATGDNKTVEIISIGSKMKRQTSIKTEHHCFGVAVAGDMLYIITPLGGQEVYEHKLTDSSLERTICPLDSQGHKRFSNTKRIRTSEDGSRLFVTDWNKGLFILDTRTGNVLHHVEVGKAQGVCLGEDGGLFVVVKNPNKIIHLDRNGTTLGTVVTEEMMEGLWPATVSYHRNTARLAVSVIKSIDEGCDYMFVFHMK